MGGVKAHELSYCYILTGSREERCLKKEMDGTDICENRGCAYLAIAREVSERLMNEKGPGLPNAK